jgi:hypothetical protein
MENQEVLQIYLGLFGKLVMCLQCFKKKKKDSTKKVLTPGQNAI